MITCSNCDFHISTLICDICSKESKTDISFCKECSKIHMTNKKYENHAFHALKMISHDVCCNCNLNTSKFRCLDCPVSDQYYCLGCSIVHTKVKITRNHTLIVLEVNKTSITTIQRIYRYLRDFTPLFEFQEVIKSYSIGTVSVEKIIMYSFGIVLSVVLFYLSRSFFGRNASSIITVVSAILLLRFIQKRQKNVFIKF